MKRDMDLVRELLLRLEPIPVRPGATLLYGHHPDLQVEGFTPPEINYHLELLRDAKLIRGSKDQPRLGSGIKFESLTWAGHDFLDSVRSPQVWTKTKEGAEAAGGFTLDLIRDLAKSILKQKLREIVGVEL